MAVANTGAYYNKATITTVESFIITAPGIDNSFKLYLLVGFDSQVYPGVLWEVTRVGKGFAALGAFVRLGLAHVDLGVELEVSLRSENLEKNKILF